MSGVLHGMLGALKDPTKVAFLRFDGANGSTTFYDEYAGANWIGIGTAQLSTTQSKSGGSSLATAGTNSYIYPASNAPFNWGTGNFTIQFWVYPTWHTNFFFDTTPVGGPYRDLLFIENTGVLTYYSGGANRMTWTWPEYNTWKHVALCRSSGTTKLFVDGVQVGNTYANDTTNWSGIASGRPGIGVFGYQPTNGGYRLRGYIDDFQAVARALYTENFTPPGA